jgi:hypothetical protein
MGPTSKKLGRLRSTSVPPSNDWRWEAWSKPMLERIRAAGPAGIHVEELFPSRAGLRNRHALAWLEERGEVVCRGKTWFLAEPSLTE